MTGYRCAFDPRILAEHRLRRASFLFDTLVVVVHNDVLFVCCLCENISIQESGSSREGYKQSPLIGLPLAIANGGIIDGGGSGPPNCYIQTTERDEHSIGAK